MPTLPWKKAVVADSILSGLRSKGSSSLVVQTGFPTSLADLIVKNHSRLKKYSRKKRTNPPLSDPSAERSSSGVAQFLELVSSDPVIEKSIYVDRRTVLGFLSRLLAGSLILLAALVIGRKKLVLYITFSAFSLLLLEHCELRNWDFRNPFKETKKWLDSIFASYERESASPISEISLPVSDGKAEESRIPDNCSEFSEIHNIAEVRRKGEAEPPVNAKTKKLVRKFKLIPHPLEPTKETLTDKDEFKKAEEEDDINDEMHSVKACYGNFGDGGETDRLHRNLDENKLGKFSQYVLFLIVLFGLVRGKTIALSLALAWCFLLKFIKVVSSTGNII